MVNFSICNEISKNAAHPLYEAFSTQGFLWFHNLAAVDPYAILPVTGALITWVNIMMM